VGTAQGRLCPPYRFCISIAGAALQSRFRQGLALHRQSDLAAAERVYLEILDSEPGHFDALHMLGVVALQTRRAERGIELIEQAIGRNARVASAHNNLGKALLDLKRPDQALSSFDRAITLDPRFAEAHATAAMPWSSSDAPSRRSRATGRRSR
jgi:tetratricopeptide (TPR) repeat protein